MIDEFQDNNDLQKDLLFLLAEKPEITNTTVPGAKDLSPEKLFFVGDEKQSIYRFRGADVSVFRKLKNELGSKDLPLKTNYRSAPLLIGAFNVIFGGMAFDPEGKSGTAEGPAVFAPELSSTLPLFEASFSPLRAGKEGRGKLTLCILDKKDSQEDIAGNLTESETEDMIPRLSAVENEALYIAERINVLLKEKNEADEPKYKPGDIAILFRSRSPQHFFEKHLMLLNIPFISEDLNDFFYDGTVNDLMCVLRLAAYPTDRAAYAQMLSSPFAGLSMPGLAICLAILDKSSAGDQSSAENYNPAEPFGDEPLSLLPENDRIKYCHGQRIYRRISDNTCTKNISSLITELWFGEGYRYETEWNPITAAYQEMYDYLFHLAAQADEKNQGLAAFTDSLQLLYNTGERLSDIEIPLEHSGSSAVHLTTIHKSKGLEFPVVFLCCCDKHSLRIGGDIIFDTGDSSLTVNPILPAECKNIKDIKYNYFRERSLALEKRKKTAELRRLLYVGMTRAEQELFISGCLDISGKEDSDIHSDDFSMNLKRYVDEQVAKTAERNCIAGDSIIDNDTFFGLCLPSFAAHISQENYEPSFFNIEKIPVLSENYVHGTEQSGLFFSNDQKGLNAFFKKTAPYYKGKVIETPVVSKKHFTPASLSPEKIPLPGNFPISMEYSGKNAMDVFGRVDTLLDHYSRQYGEDNEKFNSGSFGTIAHICAEALLSGQEAIIPPKLAGLLTPADAGIFLEAGKELALRFADSPLGIIAGKSNNRKSEFPFRSLINNDSENELFINGTIDLVFEDAQTVYVVDFKTDGQEFPGIHIAQMACYYRAALDLFAVPSNKKCVIWLYYLRTGHAVDVTEQARDFNLEKTIGR
jgi:ATP-dependent helicase/nuclease subunit A